MEGIHGTLNKKSFPDGTGNDCLADDVFHVSSPELRTNL